MTKIDIISGFLGSGKTTFIRKLLKEVLYNEKVVLIENEFGEIGIDGGFLQDAGIEIREMNSGCICCSLVGDFSEALKKVLQEFTPDRVIIEPSGVGKLSDVIKAVKEVTNQSKSTLNSLTTIADANKCKMYMKNFGEFFNDQIAHADTIVFSRTQTTKDDKLQEIVHEIKEVNTHAHVITTPWETLAGKEILSVMENETSLENQLLEESHVCLCGGHDHTHDHHSHACKTHEHPHEHGETCGCSHDHDHNESCGCSHHHKDHHAEEVFMSWGKETPRKYSHEEIETILHALSNTETYGVILRAKGMLESMDDKWLYFDMVPGEHEIRDGGPTYIGRFCVIGSSLKIEALQDLFKVS